MNDEVLTDIDINLHLTSYIENGEVKFDVTVDDTINELNFDEKLALSTKIIHNLADNMVDCLIQMPQCDFAECFNDMEILNIEDEKELEDTKKIYISAMLDELIRRSTQLNYNIIKNVEEIKLNGKSNYEILECMVLGYKHLKDGSSVPTDAIFTDGVSIENITQTIFEMGSELAGWLIDTLNMPTDEINKVIQHTYKDIANCLSTEIKEME